MSANIQLLLAEDDKNLQELVEEVLIEAGYDVLVASSGKQALAALEANQTQLKAVITDIRLGEGPDGWDVGRQARLLFPFMPVLYMSGDCMDEWPTNGVSNSVFFSKPCKLTSIVTAVSTLVNEENFRRTGQKTVWISGHQ
jgi:DNA-binding response OmpR family regulator